MLRTEPKVSACRFLSLSHFSPAAAIKSGVSRGAENAMTAIVCPTRSRRKQSSSLLTSTPTRTSLPTSPNIARASAATSGTKDYAHLSCTLREGGHKLSLPCNPDDEACFPAFKACRSHLRSASRNADTMRRLLPPTGECGHSIFTASTPVV